MHSNATCYGSYRFTWIISCNFSFALVLMLALGLCWNPVARLLAMNAKELKPCTSRDSSVEPIQEFWVCRTSAVQHAGTHLHALVQHVPNCWAHAGGTLPRFPRTNLSWAYCGHLRTHGKRWKSLSLRIFWCISLCKHVCKVFSADGCSGSLSFLVLLHHERFPRILKVDIAREI